MTQLRTVCPALTPRASTFSRRAAFTLRNLFQCGLGVALSLLSLSPLQAQETECARVKIEVKQDLALERQAFDAEMRISNSLDTASLTDVGVVVKITDEAGVPIAISNDPNSVSAKFFSRISNLENIANVEGSGTVPPKLTSVINWLIIPAPGAAANAPLGKKFLIGATLTYKFAGEMHTLELAPDVITVKPLPLLTLDYFLTQEVLADDPLTPEIEPVEPFTLGVRVKNSGVAVAKSLKIDSAQPKIVDNAQGLLINFKLDGSYVNDAPVQNTLLVDFGDIGAGTSKMGRWIMETALAGRFTEFSAKFTHADALGGALTSILQGTNAHLLLRDVRVDLAGRDYVRDFLAKDGDVLRVYESNGTDNLVTDLSGVAQLTTSISVSGNAVYRLIVPPTQGFVFVKLPDPFEGQKALGRIVRSDGKEMVAENVWLSKARNPETKKLNYWLNFFDANTPGSYDAEFQAPQIVAQPPVIQIVPDHVVKEEQALSFLVEASSPNGKPVTLSAATPTGARFTIQAADPQAPSVTRAVFEWTPAKGTAGNYSIVYTATDGSLSSSRSSNIKVEVNAPPPGPGTPILNAPVSGAQVTTLRPSMSVLTSIADKDPTTKVQFEVYLDEAMAQLADSATVLKTAAPVGTALPTSWTPALDLADNTHYWWRARAFDGDKMYSPWVNGQFFVNQFNDGPDSFNLTSPVSNSEVGSLQPTLSWTNSHDKDGDPIRYDVAVYGDAAQTVRVSGAAGIAPGADGSTSWTLDVALSNHGTYYWTVTASDAVGAQMPTATRTFVVNTGNTPPGEPVILSPVVGGQSMNKTTALVVRNSVDAEGDSITYLFEMDTVNTFDSGDKRTSGPVIAGGGETSSWSVADLVENKRYYWRVKAQDGRAESAWAGADFLMNAVNEAPFTPTVKNPGNGAWTAALQPSLEANPVVDPEGDPVRYQFEVYRDSTLKNKVVDGISTNTGWIVSTPLADKRSHWWRVRALDPQNATSSWGPATLLYVSTAPYQDPTIQVTAPTLPTVPDTVIVDGVPKKQVTLRWQGTDPNIEPSVSLYYSKSNSGYAGSRIVEGLPQEAGTHTGSYLWDVTTLAPDAYYVYAVIYDAKGVGRAYAPGAVVIPNPTSSGQIVVNSGKKLMITSESGRRAKFTVQLNQAPRADVMVPLSSTRPREGAVSPPNLVFTTKNWSSPQTVTVTGQDDCAPDRKQRYQILTGKSISTDPSFIGLSGKAVELENQGSGDKRFTTNNRAIYICALSVVNTRKLDARTWEYLLSAELTNTGADLRGVTAKLSRMPFGMQLSDGQLKFGAVASGETVKSSDTISVRARGPIPLEVLQLGIGIEWNVSIQQ